MGLQATMTSENPGSDRGVCSLPCMCDSNTLCEKNEVSAGCVLVKLGHMLVYSKASASAVKRSGKASLDSLHQQARQSQQESVHEWNFSCLGSSFKRVLSLDIRGSSLSLGVN